MQVGRAQLRRNGTPRISTKAARRKHHATRVARTLIDEQIRRLIRIQMSQPVHQSLKATARAECCNTVTTSNQSSYFRCTGGA